MVTIENLIEDQAGEVVISEQVLEDLWKEISGDEDDISSKHAKLQFISDFKQVFSDEFPGEFHFRTPGWKVSVKKTLVKSAIVLPALCGVLLLFGATAGLAAAAVPTVLPMLFDIEQVELKASEEEIFAKLPVNENMKKYKTAKEWYHSLPNPIQKQINELDFLDFMQKLVDGGLALENEKGKFEIYGRGKKKLKLTFS